jgi:hypothetical protein
MPESTATSRALSHKEAMDAAGSLFDFSPLYSGELLLHAAISDFSESGILEVISAGELLSFFSSPSELFAIRDTRFTSFAGLINEMLKPNPMPSAEAVAALRFSRTMAYLQRHSLATIGVVIALIDALRRRDPQLTITLRRYLIGPVNNAATAAAEPDAMREQ